METLNLVDKSILWIPVTERLPEDESDVLVVVHPCWSTQPYHEIGQWRKGRYWCVPDDASPVTHWAPLPTIPEPQTNKYIENIILYLNYIEGDNLEKCLSLLRFFTTNHRDAPGSSNNHQAYKSGYYKHINDVLDYALFLYSELSSREPLDFSLADAILVLFLHDIEKPIKYSKDYNGIKDSETIRNNLIKQFDIQLTEEQNLAIKYIHGENLDYKKNERVMSPLCAFCHCCDIISARIFCN